MLAMSAERDSAEVSCCIVHPDKDIDTQGNGIKVVNALTAEAVEGYEGQHVDERHWQHYVELAEHDDAQVGDGILVLAVKLLDVDIQKKGQVGHEEDE